MKTMVMVIAALVATAIGTASAEARYYSAATPDFLEPDRAGMQDGPNRYAYVHNDPVNEIDPTGKFGIIYPIRNTGLVDPVTLSTQAMLAEEKALEFEVDYNEVPITFLTRDENGNRSWQSNTIDWSLIRWVPLVQLDLDCADDPGPAGRTYRDEPTWPVATIHVFPRAIQRAIRDPNALAATMLHESVHASIDAFVNSTRGSLQASKAQFWYETVGYSPYYGSALRPDSMTEVAAYSIEAMSFGHIVTPFMPPPP